MKKSFFLAIFLLFVLIVILNGCAKKTETCTDSDGGQTYDVKGAVTYQGNTDEDTCRDTNTLRENYCLNNVEQKETHTCNCVDGRCTETTCVPSTEICDGKDNNCDNVVDEGCTVTPPPGDTRDVFATVDFETGDTSQVDELSAPSAVSGCCTTILCTSHSSCDSTVPFCYSKGSNYAVLQSDTIDGYTILPRAGSYFGRITQRAGEYPFSDASNSHNACVGDSHFEFGMEGHQAPLDQDSWYGISIYVPTSFEGNTGTGEELNALQFHTSAEGQGSGTGQSPIYALKIGNKGDDNWYIASKLDRHKSAGNIASSPLERNKWTDFVIHVYWTTGNNGVFEIWKNGEKFYSEYNVNTQHPGLTLGPNIRWGSYSKEFWSTTDYAKNNYFYELRTD